MCHSLAFETIGGTVRTLRHGEPRQVVADILSFYRAGNRGAARSRPAGRAPAGRRQPDPRRDPVRPAPAPTPAPRATRRSARSSRRAAPAANATRSTAPAAGSLNFGIRPVAFPVRYMLHGWFDHRAAPDHAQRPGQRDGHGSQACLSCHRANASIGRDRSADPERRELPRLPWRRDHQPAGAVELRDVPRLSHGRGRARRCCSASRCAGGAGRRR